MVVGNLPGLVGARWIEPQGKTKIWNTDSQLECTIDFKARGFFNNDLNQFSATIKDASGKEVGSL